MPSFGTLLLVHWFSALLPPIPEDERDYYDILSVSPSCSLEDIRRAYKKKSLALHPDKIAQRGGDPVAAAEEYQHVQEAHAVLSDASQRKTYDSLQRSPTRYRSVTGGLDPAAMYENLAQASLCAKSRIVLLGVLVAGVVLLQPILIVVKVNQILQDNGGLLESTDWIIVLIPLWVFQSLFVVTLALLVCLIESHKASTFLTMLEQVAWLSGEVVLALRWDRTLTAGYSWIFIPIYIAIFLRFLGACATLRHMDYDADRMITIPYLEEKILDPGMTYENLTEEQREDLSKKYILVHVPPDFEPPNDDNDNVTPEELEEARVEASPEYEMVMHEHSKALSKVVNILFIWTTFIILVVLKLEDEIDPSWWVVFIPIWVSLGCRLLVNTFLSCCGTVSGSEIVLNTGSSNEEEEHETGPVKEEDASDLFSAPDSDVNDFFASIRSPDKSVGDTTTTAPIQKDAEVAETPKVVEANEPTTTKEGNATPKEEVKNGEGNDSKKSSDKDPAEGGGADDDDDDDSDDIFIDEDTYKAWRNAYEKAESSAMEAQAKAQGECCVILFQITTLCLLVGKLQDSYDPSSDESVGYNAIWILFPVLVVAGCTLCCCACLVYGAGESQGLDGIVERVSASKAEDPASGDAESPAEPVEQEVTEPTKVDNASTAAVPASNDVDDLD